MRQLNTLGAAVCGALLLLARPASAQTAGSPASAPTASAVAALGPEPAPPARGALDGIWKGPLQVPGGSLEVIYRFVKLTGGDYFGTLDVPLQKVSHLEVQVTQHGDTVQLYTPAAGSRFTGVLAAGGRQLVGAWQQPGFSVPMTLVFAPAPAVTAATAKSVRLTPPYREEEVAFGANGPRLAGTLTVPAGAGPFPAVVLVSDTGAQDRNGTVGGYAPLGQLADYLTRRGVAVLRFDDRGVGQSQGAPEPATAAELVADVQAGLTFLRNRPEADQARLGVVGHGEGGTVALLAATQPQPPAFVVALAAAGLPGRELMLQQQGNTLRQLGTPEDQVVATVKRQQAMFDVIRQTPDNAQAQAVVAKMLRENNAADAAAAQRSAAEMTSAHYRYFLDFNPADKLKAVTCPVLLLNGTADGFVTANANLNALQKGLTGSRGLTVKALPGVNHQFQPEFAQWPIVSGQPKPTFSPLAEETIRAWIMDLNPAKR